MSKLKKSRVSRRRGAYARRSASKRLAGSKPTSRDFRVAMDAPVFSYLPESSQPSSFSPDRESVCGFFDEAPGRPGYDSAVGSRLSGCFDDSEWTSPAF